MDNNKFREDSEKIIAYALEGVMPGEAVKSVLKDKTFGNGQLYLVGVGKAAWRMTEAAIEVLKASNIPYEKGIVLTKYGHVYGDLDKVQCMEAGHPVPDENSFRGTEEILEMTKALSAEDTVIFLLSGGGSALFEKPIIDGEELADVTDQLLAAGADIVEINSVRKRLSKVKGGRFAKHCSPAKVMTIILSDIIGNPVDMIASGPACPDSSTCEMAQDVIDKYGIRLSSKGKGAMDVETPKDLFNVETYITGSVDQLCKGALDKAKELGYETVYLTSCLDCEAGEAGKFFGAIAKTHGNTNRKIAVVAGGETVVHLKGNGKGGRNQEMALTAAVTMAGLENIMFFSVGSDGTDGPTDAAGGIVDGSTYEKLKKQGFDVEAELANNNSYELLKAVDGLVMTGPTGTNVNDFSVLLMDSTNSNASRELNDSNCQCKGTNKAGREPWSRNAIKGTRRTGWTAK